MCVNARKSARVSSHQSTRMVAVTGGQIQIEATHFRKFEIEQIAKDVKAEVVYLTPVPDDHKKKRNEK